MAAAINGNKTLTSIDIGGNNIGPDGAKALAAALQGNEALRSLEMGYNPIGAEGVKALTEIFRHDMKVGLFIQRKVTRYLVKLCTGTYWQLVHWLQLETLKLGWCKIGGGDGAKAVADLIMFNTTLRTLDVRGNGFGNDGKAQK